MDTMPSSEFRRRYPKLKRATLVTVNDHIIGTWVPGSLPDYRFEETTEGAERTRRTITPTDRFNTQPFTGPIPKVRK